MPLLVSFSANQAMPDTILFMKKYRLTVPRFFGGCVYSILMLNLKNSKAEKYSGIFLKKRYPG
jgi:hypothetical protein